MEMIDIDFKLFDSSKESIPDNPGNYLVCLKSGVELPETSISPIFSDYHGLRVLYTGISKKLRSRYEMHFLKENAGRSTLRLSLGVLFGYEQVPRDKNSNNGKTKFSLPDEKSLSDWMKENLIFFYCQNADYKCTEKELIKYFQPPLNKDKRNSVNFEYRRLITTLRKKSNHDTSTSQLNTALR
jgi:hypothetical protein